MTPPKRTKTDEERLKSAEYVWVKNSDTKVMCLRCNKPQATYHKFQKVLDNRVFIGLFCCNCHKPSPLTEEKGYQEVTK